MPYAEEYIDRKARLLGQLSAGILPSQRPDTIPVFHQTPDRTQYLHREPRLACRHGLC